MNATFAHSNVQAILFDHAVKIGQGQPRVIIHINIVGLEYLMLHAKFQDHRTSGSDEEDV